MKIDILKSDLERLIALFSFLKDNFPELSDDINMLGSSRKGLALEVKPITSSRTKSQEGFYRMWARKFAKECGMTDGEMHEEMLCQTYGFQEYQTPFGRKKRPNKRSGDTDIHSYSELIDTLVRICSEMGFVIPEQPHE
tara:strand:- start:5198 stop:5614 length:417 start_codon:yes stop_codon:yes gene_type:complete